MLLIKVLGTYINALEELASFLPGFELSLQLVVAEDCPT
jgi:hypothetical protein